MERSLQYNLACFAPAGRRAWHTITVDQVGSVVEAGHFG
jgi:hypothetical protein